MSDTQPLRQMKALFEAGDILMFRPIETWTDEGGQKRSKVDYKNILYIPFEELSDELFEQMGRIAADHMTNLFFGVCPRLSSGGESELAWQIRTVRCLWLDIDGVTVGVVKDRIRDAGLPEPSIIVETGNGVHLYWLLDEPFRIDAPDPPAVKQEWVEIGGKPKPISYFIDEHGDRVNLHDPATGRSLRHNHPKLPDDAMKIQDTIRGMASAIGGDHTHDLSRIMRLAGTLNRKNQRNGSEPKACRLVSITDKRYPFSVFEQFAEKSPDAKKRKTVAAVALPSRKKLTSKRKDRLGELAADCAVAPPGTRSEADFALLAWTAENGIDPEEVWSLVCDVGKFAERGREYFDMTLEKAQERCKLKIVEKAEQKARRHDPTPYVESEDIDPRTVVEVTADEYAVNAAVVKAIGSDPDIFHRGGMLVRPTRVDVDGVERLRIGDLGQHVLRDIMTRHVRFEETIERGDDIQTTQRHPPNWCVQYVLDCGHWPNVSPLYGVVEHPFMRPDGSILAADGYDRPTGLILDKTCDVPSLPDRPSLADAKAAIGRLCDLVSDFPFSGEPHLAAWVAHLLTSPARPAFRGCVPLLLLDGTTPGVGKTLLADTSEYILTGKPAARMPAPNDDDEFRKRITSIAINGTPRILLDNIAGPLGCASLDSALTATMWSDRLLGANKTVELPLNTILAASGNNILLKGDIHRRVMHCRLEATCERPEDRSGFKYPNLVEHILDHRGEYLRDVLIPLRAYHIAGRPKQKMPVWGSYESWSNLVRATVVWCGLADPAQTRVELSSQADTETASFRAVLESWSAADNQGEGLRIAELLKRLTPENLPEPLEKLADAIIEFCPSKQGGLPTPKLLGNRLRKFRRRVIGGKMLDSHNDRTGVAVWTLKESSSSAGSAGSCRVSTDHLYAGEKKNASDNRLVFSNQKSERLEKTQHDHADPAEEEICTVRI